MERNSKGQWFKGFKPWNAGIAKKRLCKTCNKEITHGTWRRVYCSQECKLNGYWGRINKGLNKGRKMSEEVKQKISEGIKRLNRLDDKNTNWKGNKVGYQGLHIWIRRKLGKASKCNFCRSTRKRIYHWANISGEYKRDSNDFMELCPECHVAYDRGLIDIFAQKEGIYVS